MKKIFLSLFLSVIAAFAFADNTKYKGDINDDGEISLADMVKLASDILNNVSYDSAHDLNNDKTIDDADLQQLADIILNNIRKPQSGFDIGIGGWGEGGEFGGSVGAKSRTVASPDLFSVSKIKFDEKQRRFYFDIDLAGQNNTLFCSAIINIKLPQNLSFCLDDGQNPIVECNSEGFIADKHLIYGKPTLQKDGSLRFIVFDKQLADFTRTDGTIARVYVTSQETNGTIAILPSELATSGNKGVGSTVKKTEEISFDLAELSVYKITYMLDGLEYKTVEVKCGAEISPEVAPQKEGYTFSGWSEIPATMPSKDFTVTGTFSVNTYKITYMVDGAEYKTVEMAFGAEITPEAEPQEEGRVFSGWSGIPTFMPACDITITGSFDARVFKITYMVDGQEYKTVEVAFGETIEPETEPQKEGHTFSGWSEHPSTMPSRNLTVTGTFSVNTYKITYMVDGEEYKTVEMAFGAEITPEATPQKEGHTFSGWSAIPSTMPSKDLTVTGTFSVNAYKLTYMVDGEEYKTVEMAFGAEITPEATPQKEGHTFSGWSAIPSTMPSKDLTVTGTFSVNAYKLTYMVDGEEYKTVEMAFGAEITPEATPQKEGHTFSGWSAIPSTMPSKNFTVTGTFSVNAYKLTYMVDGQEYKTVEVAYGETIEPEAEPQKEGHTFSGWSEHPSTMPSRNLTVTGTFSVNAYKLTYMVDGKEYKTVEMVFGTEITPEAEPQEEGRVFSGWSGIPTFMPARDITITGSFDASVFKITYMVDDDEYKTVEMEFGAVITPEAVPQKEGHTFSGWSEIPSTMPSKNLTVRGTFSVNTYKLTYIVDGEEYKTVEVAFGSEIRPEAVPQKEGHTFSGWSELLSTMPSKDLTVTGTFSVNAYKLTYMVDWEEYKTVEVTFGTVITPEAEPRKEGHTFSGWSELPSTMPSRNLTVTGTFSVNTYKLTYIVDGKEYKTVEVAFGVAISPEAAPQKEGYTFSGWSELPSTMPSRNLTVTGTFSVNAYKLTYMVDGEEYKTAEVTFGTVITPEAEPRKEGHTFSGWSELPSTMPSRNLTVTGTFSVNAYKLTYMVDGEEYKTAEVTFGTVITPEAEPRKEGHTFSGWSELPSTMPSRNLTVTGTFSVNAYKLMYMVDGEEYKTVEVAYGETVEAEIEPQKEGYAFSGWSEIPATMPAEDIIVTGSFTLVDAIDEMPSSDRKVNVYNMKGIKVCEQISMKEALTQLPKGIYIINGRKIYIR